MRAKRSRQLPTAMSIVSPKIRYRCCAYEMTCGTHQCVHGCTQAHASTRKHTRRRTCVLPPLTYSATGSLAPVTMRPISMCATQWLTPTSGFFHICDSIRATTAHTRSGPAGGAGGRAGGDAWDTADRRARRRGGRPGGGRRDVLCRVSRGPGGLAAHGRARARAHRQQGAGAAAAPTRGKSRARGAHRPCRGPWCSRRSLARPA